MNATANLPVGTIALLFTDIEGSTRLATQLERAWPHVLAEHHRIVGGAIAAEGGHVERTEGDAFFATFDEPGAGARAAVAALRGLRGHGWPSAVGELKVRMGLHVGYVERNETGCIGLEVHRAARVASAAHGGQLLMTAAARELTGDVVEVEPVGAHRLKDFPIPEALFCADVDGRGSAHFPPPRAYEVRPTNLPAGVPAMVGRDAELHEVCELLSQRGERLVTVTGRGGAGKTSLALVAGGALLGEHPGGVWLVPLATVQDARGVLGAVAAAVGGEGDLETTALRAITTRIGERGPVLLILDNLEHLIPGVGTDLAALLDALPHLRVLCTSQVPLRIGAERVVALDALEDEAALALIQRVVTRRARKLPTGSTDRERLLDIVHLLDGLPLALELAAARLALLGPVQLRDRLRSSLEILHDDRADRPERQRSLLATLDWTLGLLDAQARELFVRLGVFAAPVELELLESVIGDDGAEVLDALAELLDVNLVRRVETGDGRIRFGLPEALRQIASARLDASVDGQRWRQSHAVRVGEIIWAARTISVTRTVYDAAVEAGSEATAGLRWARRAGDPVAARIIAGRAMMLADHGRLREALDLLAALEDSPPGDREAHVYALIARAHVLTVLNRVDEAEADSQLAVALAPDARAEAAALIYAGLVHLFGGELERGLADHLRASELARHIDAATLAGALMLEAQARLTVGQLDQVAPVLAEAERIGLPVEAVLLDRRMTIYADLSMALGRTREALERYAQSLEYAQAAGNELQVAFDLRGVVKPLSVLRQDEEVLEIVGMAQAHVSELGGPGASLIGHLQGAGEIAACRDRLGPERAGACLARGRAVPAARRVERACALARAATLAPTGA